MLSTSASTSNRLLKKAAHCVLGRPSPCDVPQGYASVAALPAALLSAFLSSLAEVICIICDHEVLADGIPERLRSVHPGRAAF
jgi:hypothetical protein